MAPHPLLPPGAVAPDEYDARLNAKVASVQATLGSLLAPGVELTVARSSPQGYRLRAEFRVWHDGDALDYVMFDTVRKCVRCVWNRGRIGRTAITFEPKPLL